MFLFLFLLGKNADIGRKADFFRWKGCHVGAGLVKNPDSLQRKGTAADCRDFFARVTCLMGLCWDDGDKAAFRDVNLNDIAGLIVFALELDGLGETVRARGDDFGDLGYRLTL